MSSKAKTNRANSKHSTGPKTEAGKQRSSRNALRHGLTGQTVVMPAEDLKAYQAHLKSFTDDHTPKGALESNLVQALADATWRLNRVAALDANLLAVPPTAGQDLIVFLERQAKAIAVLSLHSQRLSRQIEKTAAQLRDLQKTRLSKEEHDLDKLLTIMEMYESRGQPYAPSEDGFVFTQTEIDNAIQARDRERLVDEALEDSESADTEDTNDEELATT